MSGWHLRHQADVVTNHIRHHLSQLKDASQYAIALEAQVAPPPAAGSTEKEMLAFQAEDVIYLTRSVDAHAGTFTDPRAKGLADRVRPRATTGGTDAQSRRRAGVVARLPRGRPDQAHGRLPARPRCGSQR